MAHSAIEWAQNQCGAQLKGCRWLSQALGITGGQGCFWTDLVRCEQDCGQPPLIAADSSTTGGWDCYLKAEYWRLNSTNVIGVTLNAWASLTDEDDPRRYAAPAARIIGVRDIWRQSLWQAASDPTHPVIDFYYSPWHGSLSWDRYKPQAWADQEAGISPSPNVWPGLATEEEGDLRPSTDCFVVDVTFTAPDGKPLGTATALFNALAW